MPPAAAAATDGVDTADADGPPMLYLDCNATTSIYPEVQAAIAAHLCEYGNPSSGHRLGAAAAAALARARESVAALINAESDDEIVFTSCGTESNHAAVWGAVMAARRRDPAVRPHVVATAVEHPAVLAHLRQLADLGLVDYTLVSVDAEGVVAAAAVAAAVVPGRTCLVAVMHSNNETGALQPVAAAAAAARAAGAPLVFADAAQSAGKVPLDVQALGVDLLTLVGHKFGAPKGVAALYVRRGTELEPLLVGGGQERGRRAGTESVLLAAALGAAAEVAARALEEGAGARLVRLRDRLAAALEAALPPGSLELNGPADAAHRLPNTLNVSLRGVESSSALLAALGDRLAASAGAACHSGGGAGAGSGVLLAMGLPAASARSALRLSVGRLTTEAEVDAAAALIAAGVKEFAGIR
jgi:cysteine desulfurase